VSSESFNSAMAVMTLLPWIAFIVAVLVSFVLELREQARMSPERVARDARERRLLAARRRDQSAASR
jgi:hypothetical protein